MNSAFRNKLGLTLALSVASITILLWNATPVGAWDTPLQDMHIRMVNNTGGFVNDCTIRIIGWNGGLPWQAPTFVNAQVFIPGWTLTGTAVVGNALVLTFAGPDLAPGFHGWFNPQYRVQGNNPVASWEAVAWFQWTLDGAPVGREVLAGFCVSSPPRVGNSDVRFDGTANTTNMVMRNLQFAISPQAIPNDEMNLDNPAVVALFTTSPDPVKPGPFIAMPGDCLEIPNVDPSITQPVAGGHTVLVKGIVEDDIGQQYELLAQFINPDYPVGLPVISLWGLILLVLALLTFGLVIEGRMHLRAKPNRL